MDAKLKAFLRSKGVPEETLDKIEQGAAPDDHEEALRKAAENLPVICECRKLIDEIQQSVNNVLKADALRAAGERGAELYSKGQRNGFDILDLPNFLKGLAR